MASAEDTAAGAVSADRVAGRGAGVPFPPPLIFAAGFGVGLAAQALVPLPGLPRLAAIAVGPAAVVVGSALVGWSFVLFRRAGTSVDPGAPTTALVTRGPYRLSRNPIYCGFALVDAGAAVWSGVTWALPFLALVLAILQRAVVLREERSLEAVFATEYSAYRRRTRRWL